MFSCTIFHTVIPQFPINSQAIKEAFADRLFKPDDDITISSDQRESLYEAIRDGMHYPEFDDNGRVDFDEVKKFMHRLLKIFKWDVYERNTLGRFSKRKHEYSMLNWYTVILLQWIQGFGLSNIIAKAIEDKRINNREVMIRYGEWEPYDGSRRHNNCIIAETLEAIDDVKIETIVWRPMFGVPGLEYVIGKRLKQEFYDDCVQNNSFHICLLKTAGDPVIAYFGLDRKIINLSGGGTYITKEKDGKTVREWLAYDLDTCSVREEISRFLEEDDER